MTKADAETRVAEGATLLDQQRPGWATRINISTLDLADITHCIIGQECGDFFKYIQVVPSRRNPCAFGFDLDRQDIADDQTRAAVFHLLQDAWIVEIANRLVSAPAPAEMVADGRLQESQP